MHTLFFRLLMAVMIYTGIIAALSALHDYPQLRGQINKVRLHDREAEKRQWLMLFYLFNEAGSGLRYFLTGNERHLAHYPSPSHLFAARKKRARAGDWEMQMEVARMHYLGNGAPRDLAETLRWLHIARDNAPSEAHEKFVSEIIAQIAPDDSSGDSPATPPAASER